MGLQGVVGHSGPATVGLTWVQSVSSEQVEPSPGEVRVGSGVQEWPAPGVTLAGLCGGQGGPRTGSMQGRETSLSKLKRAEIRCSMLSYCNRGKPGINDREDFDKFTNM